MVPLIVFVLILLAIAFGILAWYSLSLRDRMVTDRGKTYKVGKTRDWFIGIMAALFGLLMAILAIVLLILAIVRT